ncbi:tyrosine-type recombinase/integrase [Nitrospira sp. Nam80]
MLKLVTPSTEPLPEGLNIDLPPVILAELNTRARMAGEPVETYAGYVAECLAGHRFPKIGDTWLRDYCRTHYTIKEVVELYKRHHLTTLNGPHSTLCCISKYFPALYPLKLSELTRQGVTQWYFEIANRSRAQATKSLTTLRALYNKATEWELYDGKNPSAGIKKFRKFARTRFIQPGEEMKRLLDSLMTEPDVIQAYFLTCLLCGCRGGEARSMRWADLDFTKNLWHKPMTKNGTPHTIPLPDEVAGRLKALPRCGPYVFSGSGRGEYPWPIETATLYWRRIRTRAGLADVTIHDLRRTWASWAAMDGENLSVIAAVLNHSDIKQTQIYARLNAAPAYKAIAKQAAAIMASEGTAEQAAAMSAQPPPDPFGPAESSISRTILRTGITSTRRPHLTAPSSEKQYTDERDEMDWPG